MIVANIKVIIAHRNFLEDNKNIMLNRYSDIMAQLRLL